MIKNEHAIVRQKNEEGKVVPVDIVQPVLDRRSGEPIVTEDRAPGSFRALPRIHKDRILGNAEKGIVGYLESKQWVPIYQRYENGVLSSLRCWKCGRDIVGWAPALRRPEGWRPGDSDEIIMVNGQPAVKLTCFNHYREGLFAYVRPDGVVGEFSYLHCADCVITESDGDHLLTCFLSGHDFTRVNLNLYSDNVWAQWMWRWSAVELVGRNGPSKGPGDLMKEAMKRGINAR